MKAEAHLLDAESDPRSVVLEDDLVCSCFLEAKAEGKDIEDRYYSFDPSGPVE